ncbi:hypothetical protein EDB19DRAFT_1832159 [Suillus lakei]|nr:hypothetical protein EDB19DRAFT_1832159 [Suillus lakei]
MAPNQNPESKHRVFLFRLHHLADLQTLSYNQVNDFEAELQAIQSVLEGLETIILPPGQSNETILDVLQQVQVELMCFYNVPYQEFAIVLDTISTRSDFSYCLAKMSFFPQTMTLIIYSQHPIHDQTTSEIASMVLSALHNIPYKRFLLMINVIPGRILSEEIFTIPDLQITLTPTIKKLSATQVLWYTETAFSQTKCMALGKIEKVLISHHKITCILFILILEHSKYESPTIDSTAYGGALVDKSVRLYTFFTPEQEPDKLFGPIHAMDHTWIDTDDKPIDIRSPHTAYGTIFPNLDMDQVNSALNIGLDKVRTEMASTLDWMEPGINHSHMLTSSDITFDWDSDLTYMLVAIYRTAHLQYCDWYCRQFTGTKCHCANSGGGKRGASTERPSTRQAITSGDDEGRPLTSASASTSGSMSSGSTSGSSVGDTGVDIATTSLAILSVADDDSSEV